MAPGDTQEMSQWVYDAFESKKTSNQTGLSDGTEQQHTYHKGDVGFVDFGTDANAHLNTNDELVHGAQEAHAQLRSPQGHVDVNSEDEPEEEDDNIDVDEEQDTVTSPTRFSPTTPGLAGRKHTRDGALLDHTPAQDLSAMFAGRNAPTANIMGLSQLYNQTQAPSSPVGAAAENNLRSDPVWDRPSPEFRHAGLTSPMPNVSVSSPVLGRSSKRSITEPREVYVPQHESLEERLRHNVSSSPSPLNSDDELEQDSYQRRARQRKRNQAIFERLREVVAPAQAQPYQRDYSRRRLPSTFAAISTRTPARRPVNGTIPSGMTTDSPAVMERSSDGDNSSVNDEYDELGETIITSQPSSRRERSSTRRAVPKYLMSSPVAGKHANLPHNSPSEVYLTSPSKPSKFNLADYERASQEIRIADSQTGEVADSTKRPRFTSSSNSRHVVSQSQSIPPNSRRLPAHFETEASPTVQRLAEDSSQSEDGLPATAIHSSPPEVRPSSRHRKGVGDIDAEETETTKLHSIRPLYPKRSADAVTPGMSRRASSRLMYSVPETSPASTDINQHSSHKQSALSNLRYNDFVSASAPDSVSKSGSHRSVKLIRSNSTGQFATARTNLSSSQSLTNAVAEDTSLEGTAARPLLISEIAAQKSPDQSQLSGDPNINILDEGDLEYHQAVSNSADSPPRKRLKRTYGKHRSIHKEQSSQADAPHDSVPQPQAQEIARLEEPVRTRKARRVKAHQDDVEQGTNAELDKAAHAGDGDVHIAAPTKPTLAVDTDVQSVNAPPISNRVLARFKDENCYFYPATCIGQSKDDADKLQIQFDDKTIDDVEHWLVRRLELRAGDRVRTDVPGYNQKTWTVKEVKDQSPDSKMADMFGNTTAILEFIPAKRRSRDIHPTATETAEVPIASLKLTKQLWQYYADREYKYEVGLDGSRVGTPIDSRGSEPGTPRSRHKRVKSKLSIAQVSAGGTGLFSGMVFAVTYSSSKDAEKMRVMEMITRYGGRVVSDGFNELFDLDAAETPQSPSKGSADEPRTADVLQLRPDSQGLGFAALIADSHSRRAKYMQALALGLPCLHGRWITECVSAGQVVSWERFLLPAGESSFLSGAIRSRTLPGMPEVADKAAESSLQDTLDARSLLLEGMNVLLVTGKKKAEEQRKVYAFLTKALGARRVEQVSDLKEAKAVLADDGREWDWDWVYVDSSKLDEARKELLKPQGKRRKSKAAVTQAKVVSDEFVIQSLILGSLLDA